MSTRVHVQTRTPEYSSTAGFGSNTQEFKDFLDFLGCDTSGEEYAEDYECTVSNYKNAVRIVALYVHGREKPSLKAKLDELLAENYNDVDELESQFRRLETSPEDVLSFMVSFLVQRAQGEDCIYFSCF